MFERYTGSGRRAIFFARYEASQYGNPYIEPEHLLLAVLRADQALTERFIKNATLADIRKQIEERTEIRPKTSTSVDLPLNDASKRVLSYAAEEAERLGHKNIGTPHLLLGLLREEESLAAEILRANGLDPDTFREAIGSFEFAPQEPISPKRDFSVVRIISNPAGAEIEIDGKFVGHTPAELPLAAGEWNLHITKTGFLPWERKLLVLPSARQNIAADLVKGG
jgi:ATP-dependent Clp protease ATP-binding subunit ClpC